MTRTVVKFNSTERLESEQFDLLVAICGFEERSRFIAESQAARAQSMVAFTYPENRELSFASNSAFFSRMGTVHDPATTAEFAAYLRTVIEDISANDQPVRIAVDISSVDRERLASIVTVLYECGMKRELDVEFFYAVGAFESHCSPIPGTVMVNEPLPGFEGWTADPSLPIACLIGLGFENLIALAALETLEPARTVAFVAQSNDSRFNERVVKDNTPLITDREVAVVGYDMGRALDALQSVEDVVHVLRQDHRVVLVPLGPKLFALLALLVALEYREDVAVWRVSGAQTELVEDRLPTGQITRLRLAILPSG